MPRYATLLRPLGHFTNDPDGRDPGQPRPTFPCLHCGRAFRAEADRTQHLTLRVSYRKGEEMLECMELTSNAEFQSVFDTLVSVLEEMREQPGPESNLESRATGMEVEPDGPEAEAEMEGSESRVEMGGPGVETQGPETKARAGQTKADQQSMMPMQTVADESVLADCAASDAEATVLPQHERIPVAACKTHPPLGTSRCRQRLPFDKKENVCVERFPDPRAGAPINDKAMLTPDLNGYMAAAGNLGNPAHFDTCELLLTTGLTAAGRDEHLKSHLTNKALMDDINKLPHGPGWEVYEIITKVAGQADTQSYLFTRNIVDVVCDIMANPAFKEFMRYVPERHWTTADCKSQVHVRRKTTSNAMVLLASLPVDNFENAADADEKAHLKNDLTHHAMEVVTKPLQTASKD
ncbi:hypothetical protein FRC06_001996, partial [Ceratobasidium sp. 370]